MSRLLRSQSPEPICTPPLLGTITKKTHSNLRCHRCLLGLERPLTVQRLENRSPWSNWKPLIIIMIKQFTYLTLCLIQLSLLHKDLQYFPHARFFPACRISVNDRSSTTQRNFIPDAASKKKNQYNYLIFFHEEIIYLPYCSLNAAIFQVPPQCRS